MCFSGDQAEFKSDTTANRQPVQIKASLMQECKSWGTLEHGWFLRPDRQQSAVCLASICTERLQNRLIDKAFWTSCYGSLLQTFETSPIVEIVPIFFYPSVYTENKSMYIMSEK